MKTLPRGNNLADTVIQGLVLLVKQGAVTLDEFTNKESYSLP